MQLRLPLLLTSPHGDNIDRSGKTYFYNLLENRYHTKTNPILHNKSVLCSAYGWLVLLDRTSIHGRRNQCCLWNPTSSQIIDLPAFKYPSYYTRCFLSKPPTDPDCFVVFNNTYSLNHILCRVQDNAFFEIDLTNECGYRIMSMVSFQGMIYGIVRPEDKPTYAFVTVHVVGDKIETKPLMMMMIDGGDQVPWEVPSINNQSWAIYGTRYLIESPCGNELLLVSKMSFSFDLDCTMHFRVFRVDVGKMECEELDNLDDRTIFISYYGNGFCRYSESFGADALIKPNSIYFTNINGVVIYVYDLDDRSTTTLMPYPDVDIDPDKAESCWVDLSL